LVIFANAPRAETFVMNEVEEKKIKEMEKLIAQAPKRKIKVVKDKINNVEDFKKEVETIHDDLKRIEPIIAKKSFANKALDLMIIMDCTGSMGSWIKACKEEIKSIVKSI